MFSLDILGGFPFRAWRRSEYAWNHARELVHPLPAQGAWRHAEGAPEGHGEVGGRGRPSPV
jgi:hypothetical protein